jgi:hypothetical protein
MSDKPAFTLNDHAKAVKTAALKEGVVTVNGAVAEVKIPNTVYENTLPEGVTMDMVKAVHETNVNFAKGLLDATGERNMDIYTEHPSVNKIETTAQMGVKGNEVRIIGNRQIEFRSITGGDSAPLVKMNHMSMGVQSNIGRTSENKAIREHYEALFMERVSKAK